MLQAVKSFKQSKWILCIFYLYVIRNSRYGFTRIFYCNRRQYLHSIINYNFLNLSFYRSDPNHKLCVHTRLGDFVALNFHSSKEFTEQAIDFIAANGKLLTMPNGSSSEQKRKIGLSLVLFGQDKGFLQSLSYNKTVSAIWGIPN